jgi:S1-C subfamily serine protease
MEDEGMSLKWIVAVALLSSSLVVAQEPAKSQATPKVIASATAAIDDEALLLAIEAQCEALRTSGALKSVRQLLQPDAIAAPEGDAQKLPIVGVESLGPVAIRRSLMRSVALVGEYYHCVECDKWHANLSTGFAVADGRHIATCLHVLHGEPSEDGMAPLLFVADFDGQVAAVSRVVASDAAYDIAVLQCETKSFTPLPLRSEVEPGERVYCLSNPDHMFGTFTEGLVSRVYVVRGEAPGTGPEPAENEDGNADAPQHDLSKSMAQDPLLPPRAFLQVTCEFAGGSSGAPIVDAMGNVVGIAQSTRSVAVDPDAAQLEVQMVARTASPASALLRLLRR